MLPATCVHQLQAIVDCTANEALHEITLRLLSALRSSIGALSEAAILQLAPLLGRVAAKAQVELGVRIYSHGHRC